jgi:hypothetical protein
MPFFGATKPRGIILSEAKDPFSRVGAAARQVS